MPPAPVSVQDFLAELQRQTAGGVRALPPVDQWEPPFCGDAGIEIRADGSWWHEGSPMTRDSLVRLFASILRRDADGETYLVTPGEKVRVAVADAPFLGLRADRQGEGVEQVVAVTTNVGDVVAIGPEHPVRLSFATDGTPRPYVRVRGRLEARLLRPVFYDLVEWAVPGPAGHIGLYSNGAFFPLEPTP